MNHRLNKLYINKMLIIKTKYNKKNVKQNYNFSCSSTVNKF